MTPMWWLGAGLSIAFFLVSAGCSDGEDASWNPVDMLVVLAFQDCRGSISGARTVLVQHLELPKPSFCRLPVISI